MPKKIGKYQIIRELGRGGVGVVYLAQDPFLDTLVALKTTLDPPCRSSADFDNYQEKFFNEARNAGKLNHSHIVQVLNATATDDRCCLVMAYVEGVTLRNHCTFKNLLPVEKVVKIIFQTAKALDYAHKNGVVHKDIKPSNIMLPIGGEVVLVDFGAAGMAGYTKPRRPGELSGAICYAPPELVDQDRLAPHMLSPQSDIFSLGVVMYEMLSGRNPFMAETDDITAYEIINKTPEPIKFYRPDVPETVEMIIERMLEKDATNRYRSARDLAVDLSAAFDHLGPVDTEINLEEKFNVLRKVAFFKGFAHKQLAEVLKATQWLRYEQDDAIITEGEVGNCFFIILDGEVTVRKRGKALAILKVGDCFGEMAYLSCTKRTASIMAKKATILMKINDTIIKKTSVDTQLQFYKVFSTTLINRLSFASEMLTKVAH